MSQGPLCPNLSQKVQKEVFQMANRNLSCVILLGGLSVNLNHLKRTIQARVDVEDHQQDKFYQGLKNFLKDSLSI